VPTANDDTVDNADDVFDVTSIFGGVSKQPLVQVTFRGEQVTLRVDDAKEVGLSLIEASCAAEFDAVVYRVASQKMGLSIRETANLLQLMREARDALWAEREAP